MYTSLAKKEPVVYSDSLSVGYSAKPVHAGLKLSLYAGELTCLLGVNGAGKTTLLKTLCGFIPPLAGEISILGKSLKAYSHSETSLLIGVVLTEKTNAGDLTAYDLVSLGRYPHTGFFGALKKHDHEIIRQSLLSVGMYEKSAVRIAEMSDGERQKVMIAKVLSQECPIIILDEPTAFLDVSSRIETMILLRRLAREHQKAILISTHDMEQAIQMGDVFWLLKNNSPLVCGCPEDLILTGEISKFFEKNAVLFDPFTGKLNIAPPDIPVGIEGDPLPAYWLGNALVRNRRQPAPPSREYTTVNCIGKDEFIVAHPGKAPEYANSISEALALILAD
jgi:iron complex transport system ATP-binding protein